jgi:hypothetical protein
MTKQLPLDTIVSVERLATMCDVSGRHMRRILDKRKVPRPAHGQVGLADGLRAFLRYSELLTAREIVAKWVDDAEMAEFLVLCLVARWRGFEREIAAFANWSDGPQPKLARPSKRATAAHRALVQQASVAASDDHSATVPAISSLLGMK